MPQVIDATPLYRPETEELRFLPEGPYPVGEARFSWVAIQHGASAAHGSLNLFDLRTRQNLSFPLPGRPGFAFPCGDPARFVIGLERSLGIFDTSSGSWEPFAQGIDSAVSGTIVNDGLVYDGNLIFGCKDLEFKTKKAGLYLWRRSDRQLVQLRDDQICSNGKAIRQHGGRTELVDIDSPTKQIIAYPLDIAAGKLGEPRVLVDLTEDGGVPDGAILSPDGQNVIVSIYNPEPADAGETRMYSLQDGALVTVWRTPMSPQNTCPQLVETDEGVKLVITTAVEHMPADRRADATAAGTLFIADTEFRSAGAAPRFEPAVA